MSASMTVKGHKELASKFTLAGRNLPKNTDKIMQEWVGDERRRLTKTPYPPKLPNQRYIRTYTLKDSWRYSKVKTLSWRITNDANQGRGVYSGYVVGEGRQAWMHEGRWWTAEGEIGEHLPELAKEIGAEIIKDFD